MTFFSCSFIIELHCYTVLNVLTRRQSTLKSVLTISQKWLVYIHYFVNNWQSSFWWHVQKISNTIMILNTISSRKFKIELCTRTQNKLLWKQTTAVNKIFHNLKGLRNEIEFKYLHKINSLVINKNFSWFFKFLNAPLMRCRHCHFPRGQGETYREKLNLL